MNKPHEIRKKALEFAKKRQWDKAVNEYIRLSEIESNNPNVFNELGDLHLKIGNKAQAFKALHSAIDAYSQMGLYNNAVAVCKKIIRLNPGDPGVYRKLAKLRSQQGIEKEATTYGIKFLDQVDAEGVLDPEKTKEDLIDLAEALTDSPEVLQRVAEYLMNQQFNAEAGAVLENLAHAYAALGLVEEAKAAAKKMDDIGYVPDTPLAFASTAAPPSDFEETDIEQTEASEAASPVTDAELPTEFPSVPGMADPNDFDSVELGESPYSQETATATQTEQTDIDLPTFPEPEGTSPAPDGAFDIPAIGEVDLPGSEPSAPVVDETSPTPEPVDVPTSDGVYEIPSADDPESPEPEPPPAVEQTPPPPDTSPDPQPESSDRPASPISEQEVWIPNSEIPNGLEARNEGDGGVVQVSDLVDHFNAEVKSDVDADDYRSHYDLGMAYLEMDLITEAIREFQFAANSSMYQVRSLELIGLCFIKENNPALAVKQLEKGLALVGDVDRDSIGLQYNLGLAYEMLGQDEKARHCFEEVYVLDVSFRDVAEKMKK